MLCSFIKTWYVFCDFDDYQNQALHLKRKNILFVGAPGSGKGTYSRIISPILMVCIVVCHYL